jgi:hypothetical protein
MRGKHLLLIILLTFFSLCSAAQSAFTDLLKNERSSRSFYLWPVFFGGGTFFFSETGFDQQLPGYSFSGGLTFFVYEGNISFFTDALYSYRDYEGFPQSAHYRMEESTADLAIAARYEVYYLGGYVQFPLNTSIRVREWTMEDFTGISRSASFSLMGGVRITKKHLGLDLRFLFGQGPGQFLSKGLGDHWLSQISVGIMGGF